MLANKAKHQSSVTSYDGQRHRTISCSDVLINWSRKRPFIWVCSIISKITSMTQDEDVPEEDVQGPI